MVHELFPELPIMVVDDEKNFLNSIDFALRSYGITNVVCCQDSREVIPLLEKKKFSIVLLDLQMSAISGEELLSKIVEEYPEIPVIIVTALPETDTKKAENYMKAGAFDYLIKPLEIKDVTDTIRDALDLKSVYKKIIHLKKDLFSSDSRKSKSFPNIISQSEKMQSIFQAIGLIAVTSKPVLVRGEAGVGKEFVAREIHKQSYRKGKFVPFNSTGLDDDLFSDMLLGYKEKTSSDVEIDVGGLLEEAKDGTLYLDDIGDLSMQSQGKFLRLLQNRHYFSKGSDKPIPTNARIIAASKKNLSALIKVGTFRQDLYYRLNAHEIYIPPLREHKEDIPPIVTHFLKNAAKENRIKVPKIPNELFEILEKYDFPGNVSELKNMAFEAVNRYKSGNLPLDVFLLNTKINIDFKERTISSIRSHNKIPSYNKVIFRRVIPTFAEMETIYIDEVMKRSKGDISIAARLAGLNKKKFGDRLKKVRR